jgi:hypothetical protein
MLCVWFESLIKAKALNDGQTIDAQTSKPLGRSDDA